MKRVATEAALGLIGFGLFIVLAPIAAVLFVACAKLDLERWAAERRYFADLSKAIERETP